MQLLREDGAGSMMNRASDTGANFFGNPENRERMKRIGVEVGGAAVRSALIETGAQNENGEWSITGILKTIIGLKTGWTSVRAAKGAYRGARTEAAAQWGQHGGTLREAAWGTAQEAFAPTPLAGEPNPFTSSVTHVHPFAAVPYAQGYHESVHSAMPNPFATPGSTYKMGDTMPFGANYPVADNSFGAPSSSTVLAPRAIRF